jgi:hypothetical protein
MAVQQTDDTMKGEQEKAEQEMDRVPATSRKFVSVNGTSQHEMATDEILNILSLHYSERIKTSVRESSCRKGP